MLYVDVLCRAAVGGWGGVPDACVVYAAEDLGEAHALDPAHHRRVHVRHQPTLTRHLNQREKEHVRERTDCVCGTDGVELRVNGVRGVALVASRMACGIP